MVDRYFLLITAALPKLEWHICQIFSPAKHLSHLHGFSNVIFLPLVILWVKMTYSVRRKFGETDRYKNQSLRCFFFVLSCVSVKTVIHVTDIHLQAIFQWKLAKLTSGVEELAKKSYFLAWGALRGIPRFKSKETMSISTSEASFSPYPICTFPYSYSFIPFPLSTLDFIPLPVNFFLLFMCLDWNILGKNNKHIWRNIFWIPLVFSFSFLSNTTHHHFIPPSLMLAYNLCMWNQNKHHTYQVCGISDIWVSLSDG